MGGGGAGTQLNMCPDLVLECSPILPPFPSSLPSFRVPFSLFFLRQPYVLPLTAWTSSIRPAAWEDKPGGQTRSSAADKTPASHPRRRLAATVKRSCARQPTERPREQDRRLPLFCKSPALLTDNSSMEPAEWDGSNPPGRFPSWGAGTTEGVALDGR